MAKCSKRLWDQGGRLVAWSACVSRSAEVHASAMTAGVHAVAATGACYKAAHLVLHAAEPEVEHTL